MHMERSVGSAFSSFVQEKGRQGAALARPLSVVAALTAGLESLVSGTDDGAEHGVDEGGGAVGPAGLSSPLWGRQQRRFSSGGAAAGVSDIIDGTACPIDDNNGFLVLPGRDGRPLDGQWGGLLGGRYCFKRLIGVGTFAQIIEAEDTLSHAEPKKRVALKITRAGMQGVGMQESQLLSFLARCPGYHGAHVLEAHAAFPLGEHWCIPALLTILPLVALRLFCHKACLR
jgi:hypothetical protein